MNNVFLILPPPQGLLLPPGQLPGAPPARPGLPLLSMRTCCGLIQQLASVIVFIAWFSIILSFSFPCFLAEV